MKLHVERLHPDALLPSYAHAGDAGMDIFALEEAVLAPGGKAALRTGLRLAIPAGYAGFVWDKSGLAAHYHIKTMAGVIDAAYRGELLVVLTNMGKEPYLVERSSKIAQLVIAPVLALEIQEGLVANDTERGAGGFGSTGLSAGSPAAASSPPGAPLKKKFTDRPAWDEYFMMVAKVSGTMGTCLKRKVGSAVIKNKRIVTTGFNGSPPGLPHCTEVGCLFFEEEGTSCQRVIHSERNAVLQDSGNLEGGTLYTSFLPCLDCMKSIISAKIQEVVYEEEYPGYKGRYDSAKKFAEEAGVKLRQVPPVDIVGILHKYSS